MIDQTKPAQINHDSADLDWRDDPRGGAIPISRRFDDPYFSLDNGLEETRHVFLAGNDLPARFGGDVRIGELGFGTGLNFLVLWQAWSAAGCPGTIHFTTFEAFPMSPPEMARALAAFPELNRFALPLLAAMQGGSPDHDFGGIRLTIIPGDVRDTLPRWTGQADAWFLDGFSPAKNPEMWEAPVMNEVARHTAPGGTLATYTAAGHVRAKLAAAGFDVTRQPGYGRKRHMTTARMPA